MRTGGEASSVRWVGLWLLLGSCSRSGLGMRGRRFPGANGRVAFAVEKWRLPDPCLPMPHGCEPEMFSSSIETVLPSGRGRRVLRAFPVEQGVGESGPVWSPSGRSLTFQHGSRLAIIRADGTGLRQLPQLTNGDGEPPGRPTGGGSPSSAAASAATGSTPCVATGLPSAESLPRRFARPPGRRPARSRSSTTTTEAAALSASRTGPTRSDPTARGCGGCLAVTGEQANSPTGRPTGAGSPSSHASTSSPWGLTVDGCSG
jgi:hypothetical protein